MSANDASHDYSHAFRVAATARDLALSESRSGTAVDSLVVALAATLHDVADHKVPLATRGNRQGRACHNTETFNVAFLTLVDLLHAVPQQGGR